MYDHSPSFTAPSGEAFLGQAPVITLARIVGNDLGQRGMRMTIPSAAKRPLPFQKRVSETPGNGEPAA